MKLVICLLFFISTFTDAHDKIEKHCDTDDSNTELCFLCGCVDKSVFNMSCEESQVIQMEPDGYQMRESESRSNCPDSYSYNKCQQRNSPTISTLQQRIQVYKNCTLHESCNINKRENIKCMNYPFYCHEKSDIILLVTQFNETDRTNPIFYFSGRDHTNQKIDCDCSVSSSGSSSLHLEIFFIHLKPKTTSKVKFLTQHFLFESSSNGITMLYTHFDYIGTDFKLEIRGMEPDVEDVLFFRLYGSKLSVNCSGCRNSADVGLTTPSASSIDTTTIPTATDLSTITLPTTTTLATSDPDSSSGERTSTEDSTVDGPTSAASTDQSNSTAILGGILVAVILINIVGIALYCFLRRRKKHKIMVKLPNTSRPDEQSQYSYIDITPDKNNTNNTKSNVVQNGDQKKSSDVYSLENISKNNQYHVLEVDTYSEPGNTRGDTGAKLNRGKKQDDYDHINDGSKSKPTNNDTYNHIDSTVNTTSLSDDYNHIDSTVNTTSLSDDYNHIDSTVNTTSLSDDYNHIGDQSGLLKGKFKPKTIFEPDEEPSSTEGGDTYNHLQQ